MELILLIAGGCLVVAGLCNLYQKERIYQDQTGRNGDLKAWKSYTKTLGTRPMGKELDLMNREDFIKELATCYNIFLKEI